MKITKTELKKLEKSILLTNGKRRERILDIETVLDKIRTAENWLKKVKLPQKYWEGIEIENFCTLPNGYKYRTFYTKIRIIFSKGCWRIFGVDELECDKKSGSDGEIKFEIKLTEEAHKRIYSFTKRI